jgi:putative heme-binding domain-containing protein
LGGAALAVICSFAWSACGQDAPARKASSKEEYRSHALKSGGDALRGKAVFFDEQRTACSRCHGVTGKVGLAGPDLFAIGDKAGRREIIDSVLAPSATIAVGFSTTTVQTKSGEEFSGIIKQITAAGIELTGADAKPIRIANADIRAQRTSEVSLMPEGLEAGLTPQEFTDLIEYLVSLKQPESTAMVEHGMPGAIVQLAKPVGLKPFIAEESKFQHPVWFGTMPGEANVFLVVEHEAGKIWRLEKHAGGETKSLFAELGRNDQGTRGLLGMALHPQFRENRRYFIARHRVEDGKFATLILEREAAPDLKTDSGKPARLILQFDEATNVHYGGGMQFGPDGFFYIGMGDSGPQEDPQGHGQNTKLFLGKMLRIDVDRRDGGKPYSVPRDNPFVSRADFLPEIWAYGFRVPWRFSFDLLTKELWVGDVGQDRYEEVCIVRRGENHGWNVYEGFEPFSNRYRREGENYVMPVFAYARKFGPSVTGGYVYRADPRSSFYGVYIFGDYESKRLFGLTQENRRLKKIRQLAIAPQRIASFGRDEQGQLYLVGYEGMIYKLEFGGAVFE